MNTSEKERTPPKITKILVPVDFSIGSRTAFEEARALAKVFGASIEVFHVWSLSPLIPSDLLLLGVDRSTTTFGAAAHDDEAESLRAFLEAVGATDDPNTTAKAVQGDPVTSICEHAAAFDLVVMGTRGRTGLARLMLGSVTEAVVRKSRTPVLTVHPPAAVVSER